MAPRRQILPGLFAALVLLSSATAAEPTTPPGRWQLETLKTKDGKEYRGLVQNQGEMQIDFAEIIQPAGKPMYAVIRGIERKQVAELMPLSAELHQELEARFQLFRNRATIEAGRLEQVRLQTEMRDGVEVRVFRGDWFELTSTTGDEATRQCVVRIEQIFRAYRNLLPPRVSERQRLQVRIFGSLADYRATLRKLGLSINNTACYVPKQRLILAGSELTAFADRLRQTRDENEALRRQYVRLDGEFTRGLNRLSGELQVAKFTPDEITAELRLRKTAWKAELDGMLTKITEAERRNVAKFREVTQQMFARLNHEAFHAYLDLYVYPHDQQHVPRWLNEGLAQIFENAQLDGDTLRIDAPDRERLLAVQADHAALPLATLLNTSDGEFLANEFASTRGTSRGERLYLYSWALAYYLAFHEYRLTGSALDDYVARQLAPTDPLPAFEKLIGLPLPAFEPRFRQTLLNLRP